MGLWRKRESGQANPRDVIEEEEGGGPQEAAPVNDPGLPGSAGYGIGRLPRKKRYSNMPGNRFTFVRPDGKEE